MWARFENSSQENSAFLLFFHGEEGKRQLFPNKASGFSFESHLSTNTDFWHLRIRVSLYSLQVAGLILTGVGGLERFGFHANWDFSIGYWMECPRWDYYKEAGSESVVPAEEGTGGLCLI